MRIRTTKPEFWRSDDVAALSREDRLLFIGLWSYVDDNGVGLDDFRQIAADLFALEDDQKEVREFVREGLAKLSRRFLIARYMIDGRAYLYVTGWKKHQRIDKPAKPRYPEPPPDFKPPTSDNLPNSDHVATSSRDPRETLAPGTGEQGNRGTGEQGAADAAPRAGRGRAREHPTAAELNATASSISVHTVVAEWATRNPGTATGHRRELKRRMQELTSQGCDIALMARALDLAHSPPYRNAVACLHHAYEDARRERATPATATAIGTSSQRANAILALKGAQS